MGTKPEKKMARKVIGSQAFPGVFLRMDGSGVTSNTAPGGGTVNCQYGAGDWETLEVTTQPDGTVTIGSTVFPNVFLRLDGVGVTTQTSNGGGKVNCQYGAGDWERFRLVPQPDGSTAIASNVFNNVHLRMDGRGVTSNTAPGGGLVNAQFGVSLWEKFIISNPPRIVLNVQLIGQQTDMWCWAASGQMIMSYLGNNVSQCAQANARFGRSDCCNSPTPGGCVQGGWPEFSRWGFNSQTTAWGVALTFAQLTDQFSQNRPVAFSWGWAGGGGHMMVAAGVDTTANFVLVDDPWPPNTGDRRWISYAAYVSQAGVYSHWVDYYNIARVVSGGPAPGGGDPSDQRVGSETMSDQPTETGPGSHGDADAAAAAGLRLVPELNAADPAPGAGGPPADLSAMELGEPFEVHYVQRDALAEHRQGADPRPLLVDGNERLYPVMSGGEATAAVRVTRQEGGWVVKSVGEPRLVRDLVELRDRDSRAANARPREYLVVHVPALYKTFVGRVDANGRLVLLPIHPDPEKRMARGEPGEGSDMLARLAPEARERRSGLDERGPDGGPGRGPEHPPR